MLKNLFSASGISLIRAAVQFLMTLALTRFIDSSSYGVMAFAIPVWTFITLMSEMGLGNAIVRSEKLTSVEAGAAFKISFLSGVAGAILMTLAAYPAGHMLHDPRIVPVLFAFSIVLLVAMLSTTPRAMLERELRYSTIAKIEISATFAAVPVCIGIAMLNGGVWSLVAYHFIVQATRLGCFAFAAGRFLSLSGPLRAGMPLLAFGGWILGFNVQNFLARNVDNFLVGSYLGATALGVYGLSYQIITLPLLVITWPASNVLLATLSKTRRSDNDYSKEYVKALCFLTATLVFPFASYLVIGTETPAHAFMGPSWHDVPEVLVWLAPVGAVQSLAAYSGAVLTATGRVRLYFFFGVSNTIVLLISYAIAVHFGLTIFVVTYFVFGTFLALLNIYLILSSLSWSVLDFLKSIATGLGAAIIGTAAFLAGNMIAFQNNLNQWYFQTTLFIIFVLAFFYMNRKQIIATAKFLSEYRGKEA